MALYWNTLGVLGVAMALVAWALALLVFLTRPDRSQNRRLAAVLALEGAVWTGGPGLVYLMTRPGDTYAVQSFTQIGQPAVFFLYLAFLATIDVPLTRPLRVRGARWALWGAAIGSSLFIFLNLPHFLLRVEPTAFSLWDGVTGPWYDAGITSTALAGSSVFGLIVALSLWKRSRPSTAARSRAKGYALAFGVRDLLFASLFTGALGAVFGMPAMMYVINLGGLVYVLTLAYTILRHQLFDIELRVKWTISRGTVAAAFLASFFVVSEGAQLVFEDRVGPWLGLAAAGILVFALAPLQRVADGLAERALPGVADTDEYRVVRRRAVYRAAIESALEDGAITGKERSMLATLADQLDLTSKEALTLERDASRGGEMTQ